MERFKTAPHPALLPSYRSVPVTKPDDESCCIVIVPTELRHAEHVLFPASYGTAKFHKPLRMTRPVESKLYLRIRKSPRAATESRGICLTRLSDDRGTLLQFRDSPGLPTRSNGNLNRKSRCPGLSTNKVQLELDITSSNGLPTSAKVLLPPCHVFLHHAHRQSFCLAGIPLLLQRFAGPLLLLSPLQSRSFENRKCASSALGQQFRVITLPDVSSNCKASLVPARE